MGGLSTGARARRRRFAFRRQVLSPARRHQQPLRDHWKRLSAPPAILKFAINWSDLPQQGSQPQQRTQAQTKKPKKWRQHPPCWRCRGPVASPCSPLPTVPYAHVVSDGSFALQPTPVGLPYSGPGVHTPVKRLPRRMDLQLLVLRVPLPLLLHFAGLTILLITTDISTSRQRQRHRQPTSWAAITVKQKQAALLGPFEPALPRPLLCRVFAWRRRRRQRGALVARHAARFLVAPNMGQEKLGQRSCRQVWRLLRLGRPQLQFSNHQRR